MQSPLATNLKELGEGPRIHWLHHQIALSNGDKDKSDYYSQHISNNSHDSRKLWHELRKTLHRVSEMTLPSHKSDKSLVDQFASFIKQIKKTRDTFVPFDTENNVYPSSDPPNITAFTQVSEQWQIQGAWRAHAPPFRV